MLSGVNRGSPWAEDPAEGARHLLESALGVCTSGFLVDWQLPVGFDAGVAAEPDVWADGSLVEDKVSGVSSSGSGFFTGYTVLFGPIVGGVMMLLGTGSFGLAVVTALFLVFYSLFRGRSFGVLFLLCRLLMLFTLVLIILVWFGMWVAC